MASIRSSLWSIIGLTSTSSPVSADKCLPIDLLANLESAKSLSSEIGVAERNLTDFKDKMKEFSSASTLTINDLAQLSSYSIIPNHRFGETLIAKAAELNQQTSTTLQNELTNRVLEPLAKWRITIDELIVRLEEQRRMHHQQELLRDHIRAREEGRVRQMKTGRWSAKDGADLKRAHDALVSWKLKTEAVDSVVAESVQRDLIEARKQNGLDLLKAFDAIDKQFWSLGNQVCKLRGELIEALTSCSGEPPATTKKKKKKSKKHIESIKGETPEDKNVSVANDIPDILSSFECLRYDPDPFSPIEDDTLTVLKNAESPASPGDPFQNLSVFSMSK